MRRVGAGKGDYLLLSEGIDNDQDSRVNEDGVGGLDLHRNYPENWRPETEETTRGYTQGGAGEYPLSEVETRAVVTFLLAHPNVSVVNTMDTSVPMLLRPPSTSASDERMYPDDLALYGRSTKRASRLPVTPGPGMSTTTTVVAARSSATARISGPGSTVQSYRDELWNGGNVGDYNKDGVVNDELDRLQYNDKELKVSRFQTWTKVIHPQGAQVRRRWAAGTPSSGARIRRRSF